MIARHKPGMMKRFGRTPWRFQRTFETPLPVIDKFVSMIVSAHGHIQRASVTIDQVVFDPKHLKALTSAGDSAIQLVRDITISARDRHEVELLLQAAFSDWIDFLFVPEPKSFV